MIKLIAAGSIDRAVTIKGMRVTRGARAAVEAAGGRVEALPAADNPAAESEA